MNVKAYFLDGSLEEIIYIVQPEGSLQRVSKVCKLQKSIYGLKHAFKSWNIRFDLWMKSIGFINCLNEPYVYKRCSRNVVMVFSNSCG